MGLLAKFAYAFHSFHKQQHYAAKKKQQQNVLSQHHTQNYAGIIRKTLFFKSLKTFLESFQLSDFNEMQSKIT